MQQPSCSRGLCGQAAGADSQAFERLPDLALVTYSTDQQTPDSAPTMTAITTGVKTGDGIIPIGEDVVRGDHTTVAGNELTTILEIAGNRRPFDWEWSRARGSRCDARGLSRIQPGTRLGAGTPS